jgi:hypothetical protein
MVDLRHAQLLESLDPPDDIEHGVRRAHLVEMHGLGGRAVDPGFGLRQHLEGLRGVVANPRTERRAADAVSSAKRVMPDMPVGACARVLPG